MSQDLFSAFNELDQPPTNQQPGNRQLPDSTSHDHASPANGHNPELETDLEDDFGDFEDASQAPANAMDRYIESPEISSHNLASAKAEMETPDRAADVRRHPFAGNMDILFAADGDEYDAGADDWNDLSNNPEAAMAYSKQVIAAQAAKRERELSQARSTTTKTMPPPSVAPSKVESKRPRDPNVLFDVDEDESPNLDDDFGDFEVGNGSAPSSTTMTQHTKAPMQSVMSALDLLSLDDDGRNAHSISTSEQVTSDRQSSPTSQRQAPAPREPKPKPEPRAQDMTQDDDAWDDFEFASTPNAPSIEPKNLSTSSATQAVRSATKPTPTTPAETLPPTNVPPPGVLCSVFPSIFTSAQEALFNPLAKLDMKQRQVLIAHPATHQFLRGYLNTGLVLGHIIAGRRLRWKRDQFLAQGMRIGPAAAGGKGGMKLAGVDKSETAKEDREVLDAVRLWKAQVGKLRSAVASAAATSSARMAKLPAVPEIAEQMPVKSLKPAEGGVTAPHACTLCGLKREERVAKVDVDVDDSFGEWWLQGVSMHLICKNFWDEHKGKLKSR